MYKVIDVNNRQGNGFDDLTGKRYGRLTVKGLSDKKIGRKSYWVCLCDCGKEKLVRSDVLKCGYVQSCGCLKKEQDKINLTKFHRHYDTRPGKVKRIWGIWEHMRQRCTNPKIPCYPRYGGRGIKVCKEWEVYENFRDWALLNGYTDDLSIERIDVNGDYCPENCCWIPMKEQANNRRSSIWIEWQGMRKNLKQWSDYTGIAYGALSARYKRGIRPPELFKPSCGKPKPIFIEWNGQRKRLKEWAEECDIAYSCLISRYRKGILPPKLFEKPKFSRKKTIPR